MVAVINNYKEIEAFCDNPITEKEALDRLQDVIQTAGQLDKKVEYEKITDMRFAEKAIETVK